MRYRLTESLEKTRAQIMTPPLVASRVMDFFTSSNGDWLELGSGSGCIAQSCLDRRSPDKYVGVEIDRRLLGASPTNVNSHFIYGDVLSPRGLNSALGDQTFSHVVGNPPYGMHATSLACQSRLADLCPGITQTKDWVQLDLYFVLESLSRLRRPGEAAFIVGAPIAEDGRLAPFRRALVGAASEVECYELPRDVFDRKAEVQSYLLVARFGKSTLQKIRIGRLAGTRLDVIKTRDINPKQATNRMDFSHYEFDEWNRALFRNAGSSTLSELGATVVRGSRTKLQFETMGIECFHTSDFPTNHSKVTFELDRDHGFQSAVINDILLPRVGTRCLDRQVMVAHGQRHFTEAVYRLRAPKRNLGRIADWVLSDAGMQWRQAAASGSCAKHVTVSSLLSMPVPARQIAGKKRPKCVSNR